MPSKRGRPSAASLATAVIGGGAALRAEPPSDLSAAERVIWQAITASEAPGFFASASLCGLLKDHCRHRASADQITEVIHLFQADWLKNGSGSKRYAQLLRMREQETRAAASLATRLRLTNQARYTPQSAATLGRNTVFGPKPWEM